MTTVVILAAGKGTRMKEYTAEKTKAMLPIKCAKSNSDEERKPMLQITVENCIALGLTRFIIVVGFRSEDITEHPFFTEQKDCKFTFVQQANYSGGTADAVECSAPYIETPEFLLIFADVVAPKLQISRLLFVTKGKEGVIAVRTVEDPTRYGVVETNERSDGILILKRITEKSPCPVSNLINAGLYVFPTASFMPHVRATGKSPRGERELTDSMQSFVDAGNDIIVCQLEQLVDVGTKDEYLVNQ